MLETTMWFCFDFKEATGHSSHSIRKKILIFSRGSECTGLGSVCLISKVYLFWKKNTFTFFPFCYLLPQDLKAEQDLNKLQLPRNM